MVTKDPVDRYIDAVNDLLPYPEEKKRVVLDQLRKDVIDALGTDKRPPSVVFGSPKEVALNLSLAQDWSVSKASWTRRFLAYGIDFIILTPVVFIFFILPFIYFFAEGSIETFDRRILFYVTNLLLSIPALIFIACYFMMSEKYFSATIGKKIFGLLVIDESGIRITWSQAILRNLTKMPIIGQFLFFDVLIGMISHKTKENNQRIFDLVAGTIVVHQYSIKKKLN